MFDELNVWQTTDAFIGQQTITAHSEQFRPTALGTAGVLYTHNLLNFKQKYVFMCF